MSSRYQRSKAKIEKERKKKRKKFFKFLIVFVIILISFLFVWGKFIEPGILVSNDGVISDKDIPSSFNGLKMVQFSDVHYGTGFDEKRFDNLVSKINSYKPDIVVFTGDLIDKNYNESSDDIKLITKYLSKIDSRLGKYAVLGNHDYNSDSFDDIMYDSGFMVLKNNYDTVYYLENDPILIYGVDDVTYGSPRLDVLNSNDVSKIKYRIVIMHEPDFIDEFVNDYNVNLVLAGHSHNGQVNVPYLKNFILPKYSKKYFEKYYKVGNTDMYVSNGVGNSLYDFRLFNFPSINVFRFEKK